MKSLPSLIGVIHLPPLAGAPRSAGEDPALVLQNAGLQAIQEAQILAKAGFEAIMIENFGDTPFYKGPVPPETIASLSVIAAAVREVSRIPVGINVLRNDAQAALAIASVTGSDFIRVNVLSGVAATDQGLIEGQAATLLRNRARLASQVAILADVHVKHAKTLSSDHVLESLEDAVLRGLADGVILTGQATGKAVDFSVLEKASELTQSLSVPLYVGSGANQADLSRIRQLGARIIVSSALRKNGRAGAPLDVKRIKEFLAAYHRKKVKKAAVKARTQVKVKAGAKKRR